MTIAELADVITKAGVIGILVAIVIGGYREWFVYGPSHKRQIKDLKEDRDWWRDMALRNGALAEKAAEVATRKRNA